MIINVPRGTLVY